MQLSGRRSKKSLTDAENEESESDDESIFEDNKQLKDNVT